MLGNANMFQRFFREPRLLVTPLELRSLAAHTHTRRGLLPTKRLNNHIPVEAPPPDLPKGTRNSVHTFRRTGMLYAVFAASSKPPFARCLATNPAASG